ncbi:putative phytosulfokines 6 isoform X2 [Raphanus sativus]|uniref:Phytosulfokine n=1 Tax=Raphanus sativus TaxID=3726 RepID=A0A6J0KBY8_RAPSA|nr:putative phytosulfokines 6 isoform X2 [Raphanus sativus]
MDKKLSIMLFLFVLILLQLSELRTAQRPSQVDNEEEKGINNNNWAWATQADKISDMGQELSHLMGEEKCEESDEECMKRRMITESHLDYIYTQSHNKP